MSLHTILRKHHQPAGLAGTSGSTALERDLHRHGTLTTIIYGLLVALLLGLLFFVVWMVLMDANEGRSIRTDILAGAGISCPVLIEVMRRTIREWARTDLMAVLARKLDAAQRQSVIEALLAVDAQTAGRTQADHR